ncbi:MAG: methyltransferase domain-containing protein [Vulcanimicrobiaceae bacterium]
MLPELRCRACNAVVSDTFVDLGSSPLSNSYLRETDLDAMEPTYPLHARVCRECFLVQLPAFETPERIFGEHYPYFSSFSDTWLDHCRTYAQEVVGALDLGARSFVVEVASNDGYLLQYFAQRRIPVRGIEPAANVASAARKRGIPTDTVFLGAETAQRFVEEYGPADVVVANNVIAHVPNLHDFVQGLAVLLKRDGVLTVEFPHVLQLMEHVQFDTIYHEHFSYFGLMSAETVLPAHGLRVFDVQELATHGGSLRLWICRRESSRKETERVSTLRTRERSYGLLDMSRYAEFSSRVRLAKRDLLRYVIDTVEAGKRIAGYGAAAKGNTLLNYCGIRADMIEYVMDRNPEKIGRWLPGSRIPVVAPTVGRERRPDVLLILPWNIRNEVIAQLDDLRREGTRFVVAVPRVAVVA